MTVETLAAVTINLEAGCTGPLCEDVAAPLHEQLAGGGYDECSVLPVPVALEEWQAAHRTARKRAWRAQERGYSFAVIERHRYVDDIFEINTSLGERQGRPMSVGYRERPGDAPDPVYTCPRHAVRQYGVLQGETLRAYLWLYRSGDLALVSSILGHGDHLRDEIMYLLVYGALKAEIPCGGFLVYNRHDSGTDGLRFFKERCGFAPTPVTWERA